MGGGGMNMYFLVTGIVEVQQYMSERKPVREATTKLVIAKDATEAREKFENHFNAKTSEYSIYYSVYNVEVHETIT
jgi:DNA-dependent RNA polymerase auxiliary subunit epsilon